MVLLKMCWKEEGEKEGEEEEGEEGQREVNG